MIKSEMMIKPINIVSSWMLSWWIHRIDCNAAVVLGFSVLVGDLVVACNIQDF